MRRLPRVVNYEELERIIHSWVVGDNAERDREIMRYWLLDGLTHGDIEERYILEHPGRSISTDTIKRIINKRKHLIYEHIPG